MTPSQIGIVLRDSYGVAQVKAVTGNKIVRILKTASACTFLDISSKDLKIDGNIVIALQTSLLKYQRTSTTS